MGLCAVSGLCTVSVQTGFWEMDYAYMKAIEGPIVDGVGLGYPGFFAVPGQVRPPPLTHAQATSLVRSSSNSDSCMGCATNRAVLQACARADFVNGGAHAPPQSLSLVKLLCSLWLQALESEAAWSRFVRNGRVQLRCEVTDCE